MIKRIFQSDSIPLTILSLLVTIVIFIGSVLTGSHLACPTSAISMNFPQLAEGPIKYVLIAILLIVIPIGFRRSLGRTGILDFNERVSLYPLGLLLLTVLPSCNNLVFLVASALILMLLSRIIHIKEGEPTSPVAFSGGVIIAICTWISPFFLVLVLFLWMAIATLSNMNWRTIIWSLLGLISPLYLYFTINYIITGMLPELHFEGLIEADPIRLEGSIRLWWILYLGFFIALFVLMIFRSLRAAGKGIVIRRKIIRLGIILLIITGAISALIFRFDGASPFLSLLSVPMAVIFQEMYRAGRTWIYSVSFLIWLVLTFTITWM